jgi:hypothetical protein
MVCGVSLTAYFINLHSLSSPQYFIPSSIPLSILFYSPLYYVPFYSIPHSILLTILSYPYPIVILFPILFYSPYFPTLGEDTVLSNCRCSAFVIKSQTFSFSFVKHLSALPTTIRISKKRGGGEGGGGRKRSKGKKERKEKEVKE